MPFPQTPLPVTVWLAPGADPVSPAGWEFVEITDDVREASGVQIQAGRSDEGSQVDATQVTMTLDCRSGNYSPRNPLGQWYGRLGKGTPVQVRITRINDAFARSSGSGWGTEPASGLTWAHTSPSVWSVNGAAGLITLATANLATSAVLSGAAADDVDITHTASAPAVMTGAAWVHATLARYADANNHYRLHTEFSPGGTISVKIARVVGGANVDLTATIPAGVAYAAGTKVRTRVQAIGATLRIKAWLDGTAEPDAWTASAVDSEVTGQRTGLFEWRVVGNTNAGSVTITIDDWRMDAIRATTAVPEWPVRWDQSGNNVTAPLTGAGILRRLGTGQEALRSPMYRQITGYSRLVGYWPMEDGSDATRVTNTVPGGPAGSAVKMELGVEGPAGSAGAARFTEVSNDSVIGGSFLSASTTAGWQFSWSAKLPALPGVTTLQMMSWRTSNGYLWVLNLLSGIYQFKVVDADGTLLEETNVGFVGTGEPNQWITYRMKATASGGTVSAEFAWFVQGQDAPYGTTGTFTGTVGRLVSWSANGNAYMQNALISQVFGVTTGLDNLQSYAALRAFDGYVGETAGERLERLSAEHGIPLAVTGDPADTPTMGVQRSATFLDLVRECETADQGVLIERGAGLGYLTRVARYNAAVVLALDFAAGHVAAPPEPVDDDQRLRNQVSVRRPGGSEVTVRHDASIEVNGLYQEEIETNLQTDGHLDDHAAWRLHLGTIDELRWPRIELNLARNPSLIADWCRVRIGSRITIANPPAAVAGEPLDLIVEGWTETLATYGWDVVLACSPAEPWRVAVFDSTAARAGSASTTLGASVSSSATSLTFSTTNPKDVWSTTAEPYDVLIGGERITVTSMGAVSGSGPYTQTATVARAVNGIPKGHNAGASIGLAVPVYFGV